MVKVENNTYFPGNKIQTNTRCRSIKGCCSLKADGAQSRVL